jgi:hypothetical protein
VHNRAQSSFALNDGIRHAHLSAERGQEDDELNGVDIVGDEHQRRLLVLDEAHDVVEAVLDRVGLLADILLLLALRHRRRLFVQTLLLLGLRLGAILVEQPEALRRKVPVKRVLELRNGRRHLEPQVQDLLLALQPDVFGPLDHARQVPLRLYVLPDAEVLGPPLNLGVL